MTEQEMILWLKLNWPSAVVGLIVAAAYIRLNRFVKRLDRVEDKVSCLCDLHAEHHKEDAVKVYKSGEKAE
jgi:hypothetical protein